MKKILIVDDSEFTRGIHKRIIVSVGDYQIVEAASGADAVDIFQQEKPNLVLMDLLMPDIDGMDAIRKLLELDAEIPVIICSTDRQKYRREEAEEIGVRQFLTKPVNPEAMAAALKEVLHGS